MKKVGAAEVYLPDDETDPVMLGAGGKYQGSKLMAALKYVRNYRTAIDVGAHCGLWSMQMAKHFQNVECFEPLQRHIECWQANINGSDKCRLFQVALGNEPGIVRIHVVETQSGRSHVHPSDGIPVPLEKLDKFTFDNVDLIKIDVEGYELQVIKGGEETIKRDKPVIIVEQKPGNGSRYNESDTAAIDYLKGLGMIQKEVIAGDYVMAWQ